MSVLIRKACENLLESLFGDKILTDPNFADTPKRMAAMFSTLFTNPDLIEAQVLSYLDKSFPSSYGGMIILPEIKTVSFCPHHMLPVEYNLTIAYIPANKSSCDGRRVLGASKPERVAVKMAQRPILQEDYTMNLATVITKSIHPLGVGVIMQGFHSCMRLRGIKNPCANMITSEMTGAFFENDRTRQELFALIEWGKTNESM